MASAQPSCPQKDGYYCCNQDKRKKPSSSVLAWLSARNFSRIVIQRVNSRYWKWTMPLIFWPIQASQFLQAFLEKGVEEAANCCAAARTWSLVADRHRDSWGLITTGRHSLSTQCKKDEAVYSGQSSKKIWTTFKISQFVNASFFMSPYVLHAETRTSTKLPRSWLKNYKPQGHNRLLPVGTCTLRLKM